MRILALLGAVVGLSVTVPANVQAAFVNGNELHNWCTMPGGDGLCFSYIKGVWDMIDAAQEINIARKKFICVPSGVTIGQMKDVVLKSLNSRPEVRHLSASSLVWNALVAVWECK